MTRIASILLASLVAACASYGGSSLRPGTSNESEVRATMGTPAVEFANTEGGKDLFYPRGPLGTDTFRARVGSDGVLRDLRNVLSDDTFSAVTPGMTEQDILRMIGPPGKTMPFPLSSTHAWDYRYVDTWGYTAIFSVTFDARGVVLSKLTTRIEGRDRTR
jgi:outer membrane protein assembly factor BamE (lipoprotein component of BamABCDE complex)